MNSSNFTLANDIRRHIQFGAKGAFALSVYGDAAELCYGADMIPHLDYMIWLKCPDAQFALTNATPTLPSFDFLFDRYGTSPMAVRFVLASEGKILLDSQTSPLAGLFLIRTLPDVEAPVCVMGVLNHFGEVPNSTFIANRAPELIRFSSSMADFIIAAAGGANLE